MICYLVRPPLLTVSQHSQHDPRFPCIQPDPHHTGQGCAHGEFRKAGTGVMRGGGRGPPGSEEVQNDIRLKAQEYRWERVSEPQFWKDEEGWGGRGDCCDPR
jgi:hypothetical protein